MKRAEKWKTEMTEEQKKKFEDAEAAAQPSEKKPEESRRSRSNRSPSPAVKGAEKESPGKRRRSAKSPDKDGESNPSPSGNKERVFSRLGPKLKASERLGSPVKTRKEDESSTKKRKSDDAQKEEEPKQKGSFKYPIKCRHCPALSHSFEAYMNHLKAPIHKKAMEILSDKLNTALNSLRVQQRRESNREKPTGSHHTSRSNFCKQCKLYYSTDTAHHLESKFHNIIESFLTKKCKLCDSEFNNPVVFMHHLASGAHVRKVIEKANTQEAESEEVSKKDKKNSDKKDDDDDDGIADLNINDFVTVDEVGGEDVDDDVDLDKIVEVTLEGDEDEEEPDENAKDSSEGEEA